MGLGGVQKFLLALASAMVIISAFLIFNDELIIKLLQRSPSREVVAKITESQNDSRRRLDGSLVWLDIRKGKTIYDGDSVFSGSNSKTVVTTLDQAQIVIPENSLVRFVRDGQELFLDFRMGSIELTLSPKRKLTIRTIKTNFRLSTTDGYSKVTLSQNENQDIQIQSVQGSFTVEQNGVEKKVEDKGETELKLKMAAERTPVEPAPVPVPQQEVVVEPPPPPVPPPAPVPPPPPAPVAKPVKVAAKPKPQPKPQPKPEPKPQPPPQPKPQVKAAFSGTPLLLTPLDEANITLVGSGQASKSSVAFLWEPVEEMAEYEIEIALDGKFQSGVKKYKSKKTSIVVSDLKSEKYFWRVRAFNIQGVSGWSPVFTFQISEVSN